jgi:hypothetical protein
MKEASASPRQAAPVYRTAATGARETRDLAFDRLPPAVRDRLTSGIVHGAPTPLLAARKGSTPLALRVLVTLAVASGLGMLGIAGWHFGALYRDYAIQPHAFVAVYGALFAVLALAIAGVVRLRRFQRGAPFRSGRYLFALDLVEAEGGHLKVTSLESLRRVDARPRGVELVFTDGRPVVFPLPWHDDPAHVAARTNEAITAARALVYPADEGALQRLDPFFEVRVTDDWSAAAAERAPARVSFGVVALGIVLAAGPAGYALLAARNAVSDDVMFEEARTKRRGESRTGKLSAYENKGYRHVGEVTHLLIEAAGDNRDLLRTYMRRSDALSAQADDALYAFAQHDLDELAAYMRLRGRHAAEADERLFSLASRQGTSDAWSTYLDVGTRHRDEVQNELLPDADFAQAEKSDLVGSLFSYLRRHPGSKHEDEARHRIHAVYAEALPAFREKSPPPAGGTRFVEAMLAYVQVRADPRVTLDFDTKATPAIAEADQLLAARYGDRVLPAAARFDKVALDGLAGFVRTAVIAWFGGHFRHGVIEPQSPSKDDFDRPRISIHLEPTVVGVTKWRPPGAKTDEPDYVSPLVALLVEVRGRVPGRAGGTETTVAWRQRLVDDAEGRILERTADGLQRTRREMIEDAYARFFEVTPGRIADGFDGRM